MLERTRGLEQNMVHRVVALAQAQRSKARWELRFPAPWPKKQQKYWNMMCLQTCSDTCILYVWAPWDVFVCFLWVDLPVVLMPSCSNMSRQIHIYICIYVYMYLCIYVYMYICIYVYMYICINVYMYICIYVHLYLYIFIYVYIYIYICMYICKHVYMYICIQVFMYICLYVNMYICKYVKNVYMYICKK